MESSIRDVSTLRETSLTQVMQYLIDRPVAHPLRVAVDGRTASGKTTLSDDLARKISAKSRDVIRTSIDGFHRPREERYARGRRSAEGYYYDARDLDAVRRLLLEPLGPSGDLHYRTASFDLEKDEPITQSPRIAKLDSILLVDGTFLQRPELRGEWDVVIFIDVSKEASATRGIERDSEMLGGMASAAELYAQRYLPAFDLYNTLCSPRANADIIIDNNNIDSPVVELRA